VRPDIHNYFIEMLELVASRATCARRKVGAIITSEDNHILSTGYNGVPRGFKHCIDFPCAGAGDKPGDSRNCLAIHAEQNALLQCVDLKNANTMYTSCTPCFECAKLIANTDIHKIYTKELYTDRRGMSVLAKAGISTYLYTPGCSWLAPFAPNFRLISDLNDPGNV
jgi:dCMP deaminase